ncbi:ABC transporter ATP-binding protein [Pseudactinotalea sp. Z1739]|uniref:ABC transporter ATP-binding protein n=1 Tax=Pseudactinotalea sp. Z1739 TaxID=3413028 RepID=UPI003C7DD4DF
MAASNTTQERKSSTQVPVGAATVALSGVHMRYSVPSSDRAERVGGAPLQVAAQRLLGARPEVLVRALSGVSLLARSGESIGVIGRNGSGKSTMLRIIAGLEPPSRGTVLAESTPVLLGVNAALLPDLSGAENVRIGLLAMGKSPHEVEQLFPEVVELAGIGKSIYLPMRTYSSGMGSRLRFAIAAAAAPDILLIDEALATGDAAFRDRSEQKMTELRRGAATVFLVSHAAQTVEDMCTRAIWLHQGRIIMDGPAYETAQKYRWWSWNVANGEERKAAKLLGEAIEERRVSEVSVLENAPVAFGPPRHARKQARKV